MKNILIMLISTLVLTSTAFAKERKKISPEHVSEVTKVLEVNEKLHMAFFKYDGSEVEKFSKELESSLGSISNTEVSKLLTFAKNKLKEIQSSKSKEENYQSYHIVSMALIHVVNTYDIGGDYNAYSCPMVKKKWLQNSSKLAKVHNPYAAMMPHCGSQDTKF